MSYACKSCGKKFTLPPAVAQKYPDWIPTQCMNCKQGGKSKNKTRKGYKNGGGNTAHRLILTPEEVLEKYHDGPITGVFTDGGASPNPGKGGWGAVYVINNEIISQKSGANPNTTNNRMELTALIAGYEMLPMEAQVEMWSDSDLCVKTINVWAASWMRNDWKKKSGPIKNLALVQELYDLAIVHTHVELRWIKAHAGSRWNEYADALATEAMHNF